MGQNLCSPMLRPASSDPNHVMLEGLVMLMLYVLQWVSNGICLQCGAEEY